MEIRDRRPDGCAGGPAGAASAGRVRGSRPGSETGMGNQEAQVRVRDRIGTVHGRGHVRRRAILAILLALLLCTGSACRTGTPGAAVSAAPSGAEDPTPVDVRSSRADEPNTTHGIYTGEQAGRGLEVFREICSECHETGDWTDRAFLDRWEEASVYRLWYWIYGRMPHGRPGTLSRQQVTDALTYILELNGLPPGETELATDDDTLDDYWIIWKVQ